MNGQAPKIDRSPFVKEIGFGFADDGRVVEIRFVRKNGKIVYVPCEYSDLSTVVLRIEQAAGQHRNCKNRHSAAPILA
jgi:hypothetical protein